MLRPLLNLAVLHTLRGGSRGFAPPGRPARRVPAAPLFHAMAQLQTVGARGAPCTLATDCAGTCMYAAARGDRLVRVAAPSEAADA